MNQITRDQIDQLGPTVSIATAARLLGCGRTLAYDLVRRGEFPCRVLPLGSRYRVPTADLLRALGLDTDTDLAPSTGTD
jgi:excisionase family DNA binding protein